ncbi:UbiD family decarboxylase [Paenibacillus sp. NPDC058071]|uniref:UbiD family decarboxylase n=1 Tax=Paenibacillus sp. NPDC058071 TaxID=3346326 RepID=UPI0036DE6453
MTKGQDLRDALERLAQAGRLSRVTGEVHPKFEMAAVLAQQPNRNVVIFDRIAGSSMRAVGNVVDRINYAISCDIEPTLEASLDHITRGLEHPIEPVLTAEAPCRDVVVTEGIDLAAQLPIPTFFEKEAGPYISADIVIAKDPETGKRNVSMNRLLLLGPDQLMIGMSPSHHLHQLKLKAERLGKSLEVAIAIGNHPAVLVAANAYVDLGVDEFAIAGGMLGEPLRLSPGVTVDVEAPAGAEIVIEARFESGEYYEEGLVSEFHGMYVDYGKSPVLRVTAVTHRNDPYFQFVLPGKYHEHFLMGGMAIETTLLWNIRKSVSCAKAVYITEGGMGRCHAVVSLANPRPGEGQKAVFAAFAHCNLVKQVTVVDDDIRIDDPHEVEWAVAARMRAQQDLMIIPGVRTDRAEPLVDGGTVAKIGIIALRQQEAMPLAEIPDDVMNNVKRNWDRYKIRPADDYT